jgi:predicted RNase H-like HicB family nuclease
LKLFGICSLDIGACCCQSFIAYQFVIEIIKGTLKINPSITVLTLDVAFGIHHTSKVNSMKLKVIVHNAEEGGFWAEVPAIPGCHTQGDTWDELLRNIYEAIEACLTVDADEFNLKPDDKVLEIAV